jgi:hypothetical protein
MSDEVTFDDDSSLEAVENGSDGQNIGQKFDIGLTPFGQIGINITDSSGQTAGYLISNPEDGARIIVHLQALVTMMIQSLWAQAMQERALADEILKGTGVNGSGYWTP